MGENGNSNTLQDDEVFIKTIVGAISIGAEIPQYMNSNLADKPPLYPN